MVELIAAIVVDLSDQRLYVYNPQQELIRTVLVSTGKASSPTPIGVPGRRPPDSTSASPAATAACAYPALRPAGSSRTPPWAPRSRSRP